MSDEKTVKKRFKPSSTETYYNINGQNLKVGGVVSINGYSYRISGISDDGKNIQYERVVGGLFGLWSSADGQVQTLPYTDFCKNVLLTTPESETIPTNSVNYYTVGAQDVVLEDGKEVGGLGWLVSLDNQETGQPEFYYVRKMDGESITLVPCDVDGWTTGNPITLSAAQFDERFDSDIVEEYAGESPVGDGETPTAEEEQTPTPSIDDEEIGVEINITNGEVITSSITTITDTDQANHVMSETLAHSSLSKDSLYSKYDIPTIIYKQVDPDADESEQVLYVSNIENTDVTKLKDIFDQYKVDKDKIVKLYEDGKKQLETSKEPFDNQTWLSEYSHADTNIKSIYTDCIDQADNSPDAINKIITEYNTKLLEIKENVRLRRLIKKAADLYYTPVKGEINRQDGISCDLPGKNGAITDRIDGWKREVTSYSDVKEGEDGKCTCTRITKTIYDFDLSSADYKIIEQYFGRAQVELPYQVGSIKDM